jgi:hypothetical protein
VSRLDPDTGATRPGTRRGDLQQENGLRIRREAMLAVEQARDFLALLGLRRIANRGCNASVWALGIELQYPGLAEIFRIAPHSKTADDVIFWGEFAMSFVEASLSCGLSRLHRFPPNPIGLSVFLAGRGGGTENLWLENIRLVRLFRSEVGRGEARPP